MIPKIIWQTHENKYKDLPEFQKNIRRTWRHLNPGWKYNYVDAEQRHKDVEKYDDLLYKFYKTSSGINQADIWRLVVLYKYGGFYADMDSICVMSLDDVMNKFYNNEGIICSGIGFQSPGINNSNFASSVNNKIIKDILEEVLLYYKNAKKEISSFQPGEPCNGIFSSTMIKNKDSICFNDNYFIHSNDYKNSI